MSDFGPRAAGTVRQPLRALRSHVLRNGGTAVWLALATLRPPACAQAEASRDERWHAHLQFVTQSIRTLHPRPFFSTPEARFDSVAADLDRRIPQLTDGQVTVGLMRLVAQASGPHRVTKSGLDGFGIMLVF